MIFHETIRQEVINILRGKIQGIESFHSGRPTFRDVETDLPTIAVFIDDSDFAELTTCDDECVSDLKIGIYLPLFSTESELDKIAQQVADLMKGARLQSVDDCSLKRYTYDYDPSEHAWKTSTLTFVIRYFN